MGVEHTRASAVSSAGEDDSAASDEMCNVTEDEDQVIPNVKRKPKQPLETDGRQSTIQFKPLQTAFSGSTLNQAQSLKNLSVDHEAEALFKNAYNVYAEKRDIIVEALKAEANSLIS